jgi:hypothetical protein
VDYGAGDRSRLPNVESRLGGRYTVEGNIVAEVGIAGLLSPRRYNVAGSNNGYDTTARLVAFDAQFNLPYVTVQGEAFASDGAEDSLLGMVTGAPGSVVIASSGSTVTVTNLQSQGGWIQAVLKPIRWLDVPIGYGFEQLRYKNVGLAASTRTRNAQFTTGVIFNPLGAWKTGFEWTRTTSGYALATTGPKTVQADQFALSSRLDF